jgi:sec-independent protein translocase protein TatC
MSVDEAELDERGRMTLFEHLAELRSRLIKSILAIVAGAIVAWIFYPEILTFMTKPYCEVAHSAKQGLLSLAGAHGSCKLLALDPLEGFGTRLKVSGYGGIALAMPILLWELWRFIAPGLYDRERKWAIPFIVSALALFAMGAALAYWTLPKAINWLVGVSGPDVISLYAPGKYLTFVTYMMLAFGIGFEFPIVLIFLELLGIVKVETLIRFQRYAIVGIVLVVAIITPSGDPISLTVLSVPMVLFYELAILFGLLYNRRKRRHEARST